MVTVPCRRSQGARRKAVLAGEGMRWGSHSPSARAPACELGVNQKFTSDSVSPAVCH